jgi:hypothetical protein
VNSEHDVISSEADLELENGNIIIVQSTVGSQELLHQILYTGDIRELEKLITIEQLGVFSKTDLRILRNTIYAKYGYKFISVDLQNHFSQFLWYNGVITNADDRLTEVDRANIELIQRIERYYPESNDSTNELIRNWYFYDGIPDHSNIFNDLDALAAYLKTTNATLANPASLKLNFSLGTMTDTDSNWRRLLKILDDTGKYVALDLSSCPIAGRDFNPISNVQTGKWFIVSIVLPDDAKSIPTGNVRGSTFNYFYNLKTLSAKEITTIGLNVFNDCNDLSVSFPAVINIDENNFAGCTGLVNINFPAVTSIGKNAFRGCTNLTNLRFFNVASIDMSAFQDCTSLTSINLTTTNIGESAFQDCTSLINVSFPVAENIGTNAFNGCNSLSTINLPMAISIGNGAFQNCSSLTSMSLPMVKTIGNSDYRSIGVFQNCTSLIRVNFSVAITIGNNTFQNCNSLTSVSIPLVTTIGENAFERCSSLTSIYFPSVMRVGKLAFAFCYALASVNFPEIREFLYDSSYRGSTDTVFYGCTNLISITLGEHYSHYSSSLPGDLYERYRQGGAGTYIRTTGYNNTWTKQ